MAIDSHKGQDLVYTNAPVFPPFSLSQSNGVMKNKMCEPGNHFVPVENKNSHWVKLLLNGTATEKKESSAMGISIIAQPECENNPQICPTSQEGPMYNQDSKQYSLAESIEHIPNNVVHSTEGKPAQPKRFSKSKRKRRKRSIKEDGQKPAKRGQTTPEQETLAPVPVQDDESQSKPWGDILDYCSKQQNSRKNIGYRPENIQPIDGNKNCLHKLISPFQSVYHMGGGKLQQPSSPYFNDRLSGIISTLGLDGCEDKVNTQWSYAKLIDSCTDSKTHSVEEGVLLALRGSVSVDKPDKLCLIAKAWEKDDDDSEPVDNEGILFKEGMIPEDYEYREDIHWDKSGDVLGSGAFGDVYLGKDKTSGFQFAAKKIPVNRFRSQELTCCLSVNSEKIVPVYGAIREGPWITVFMKMLNGGSLGQMIKRRGYLTEDRALYYLSQVLQGLKHLHTDRVVHGDVKADNVLLSEDRSTAYLCDFGHAAHLPPGSSGMHLLTANYVPGTETHMAPEIVRGDPCGTKLDVWSACCMLLHMLNGWHPWSRTHTSPLCLKIATEPPPLQEIPPSSHPLTCDLIMAGLQKDPNNRATTLELKRRVDEALTTIGGLSSPCESEYREPRNFPSAKKEPETTQAKPKLFPEEPGPVLSQHVKNITQDSSFTTNVRSVETRTSCEMEIERLEIDLYRENLTQLFSPEDTQFFSKDSLHPLLSGKESMNTLDTGSSGIHSWDSQMEAWSLQSDSLFSGGSTTTPSWFNGVKVQLQTFSGETLHIWESGRTKLGDLAVGISSQIPIKPFTIVNSDGNPIPWKTDIADCDIELKCSLAQDRGGTWLWRVRKGKIEEGHLEVADTGGGRDGSIILIPE
ncbi:PREDICTED: mitogen-activated protein kinase kinase kinase 14 [Nanorana parkeri]|uniref:mitogen-activated protein kinase kinase kinase 14 n=1 Tax=Nanorana parkeri TaxID=125878 RepID=UPI000854A76C|nr:PREDICTED: mitogen-activated protein kinase kinase kinase 14 [Nanorana parkeri]XP_018410687.1 PREDICTED: mitogen-activated protein kinase kinase kinase 14 [Nanorana parkeri]